MNERIAAEVEALARLDLHELREQWCLRFGSPPLFRSTDLFRLMLAWRMQAADQGGLDLETRKTLSRTGAVEAEGRHLGSGATLRRDWQGTEVVVEVTDCGFAWNGHSFRSLSAVATAIAGTKWNGPRFFGLRS